MLTAAEPSHEVALLERAFWERAAAAALADSNVGPEEAAVAADLMVLEWRKRFRARFVQKSTGDLKD
jgi:hypothetical protein